MRDFAGAQAAETFRYAPFFHAMLDAGVYLPPSAFEAWFVNAAMDDDASRPHRRRAARRAAARGRRGRDRVTGDDHVVHLLRHGEVYNPDGVLYGRLPGFRLSELGERQAAGRGGLARRRATSATSSRRRSSGPSRPRRRSPRRSASTSPSTSG